MEQTKDEVICRINRIFTASFIAILFTGLINPAVRGTSFIVWKQVLLAFLFFLAAILVKHKVHRGIAVSFMLSVSVVYILLFISSIRLGSAFVPAYNIFFYVSWLPFFVWSANGGGRKFINSKEKFFFFYIVISCIGLIIDLNTDLFLRLNIRNEVLTMNYFQNHQEIAKRAVFIFTAPTLAISVLGGILVMYLKVNHSMLKLIGSTVTVVIVSITTASLNALLVGGCFIIGCLKYNFRFFIKAIYLVPIIGFLAFFYSQSIMTDTLALQFNRVVGNLDTSSWPNTGRFFHWKTAFQVISDFSFLEHISGAGIGCTNANYNSHVTHLHGESSLLQAYVEGGMLGVFLRILPFFLYLKSYLHCKDRCKILIAGYIFGVFVSGAVAPLFGNIPSQALLGVLVGYQFDLAYETGVKI